MALTQVTSIGLKDGEIVNADLHSAASVALSKLASTGALGSAITATTQSASDDSTKLATTAFVQAAVTSLIDGAPGSLNTLNELAAAINDDSSYATTLTTALATKLPLAGGTLTGNLAIGGNLYFDSDTDTTISNANTANWLRFITGGQTVMDITDTHHVQIHDDHRLRFGASSDIQIWHNSGNGRNYFFSPSNDVYHEFAVSNSWTLQTTAADKRIECPANGTDTGVRIYHNGSEKFRTTSGGCHSYGVLSTSSAINIGNSANLTFEDNGKATFGNSADLEIYHSGSDSIINDNGTGSIRIQSGGNNQWEFHTDGIFKGNDGRKIILGDSSDLQLYHVGTDGNYSYITDSSGRVYLKSNRFYGQAADGVNHIYWEADGQTSIYYDGGERIRTTQIGIDCYGRITTDTNNNLVAHFGTTNSTGGYVRFGLAHNGGTIGYIGSPTQLTTGDQDDLAIRAQSDIRFATGGSTLRCTIDTSGNFYPATTNASNLGSGSLRWNQGYLNKLSLNTSNTNTNFCINGAGSANVMTIRNTTGGNGNVGILFSTQDHSGGREKAAIYHQETHGSAHYGGDFIFCLNTATGSAGQVGPSDVRLRVTRGGAALANNTCKAYINFNQGNNNIRLGYNIASITDNGTGQHRITFTNAMDNNYYTVVSGGSRDQPESSRCYPTNIDGMNNGYFDATNHNDGSTNVDWELCCLAVYGLGGD